MLTIRLSNEASSVRAYIELPRLRQAALAHILRKPHPRVLDTALARAERCTPNPKHSPHQQRDELSRHRQALSPHPPKHNEFLLVGARSTRADSQFVPAAPRL